MPAVCPKRGSRFEEPLLQVTFCKGSQVEVMVHLHILPILISMRDLQQRADLASGLMIRGAEFWVSGLEVSDKAGLT